MKLEQWPVKSLGELCTVVNGGTPKSKISEYWGDDVNWITPAEMGKMNTPYIDSTNRKITELGLQKSSAKLFPPHSVILSTRAPIGHLAINTSPMSTNQGCKTLIPNDELEHKYLYYFLHYNKELLDSLGKGTTFKELSGKSLKSVEIPLPLLKEQQQIVSIIDETFDRVESSIESLQTKLRGIEQLYSNYRSSTFDEIQKTHENQNLPNICESIFAGGDKPKDNFSKFKTDEFPVPIFSNGRKDKGLFGYTDVGRVHKKCITISARGTIGYSEIREPNFLPIVRLIVAIPKTDVILVEYLKHFFDYKNFSNTGSSIPQLTIPMVKQYIVPLPSLSDQKEISSKLDDMLEQTEKITRLIEIELESFEELKQSILQKAFSGELTGGITA